MEIKKKKKTVRKTVLSGEGKENSVVAEGLDKGEINVGDTFTNEVGNNSIPSACVMTVKMEENEVLSDLEGVAKQNQEAEEAVGDCPTLVDMMESEYNIIQPQPDLKYGFNSNTDSTFSTKSRGIKRTFDQIENLNAQEKCLESKEKTLNVDPVALRKKCKKLSKRIKQLESNCMPRPEHTEVIKYFIDIGNALHSRENNVDEEMNKDIVELLDGLGLKKVDVLNCKRPTATATARQIIRIMYPAPEPDFGLANVDKFTIDSIIRVAQYLTPMPLSNKPQLRRAIGNYFATSKYANKMKSIMTWKQENGGKK